MCKQRIAPRVGCWGDVAIKDSRAVMIAEGCLNAAYAGQIVIVDIPLQDRERERIGFEAEDLCLRPAAFAFKHHDANVGPRVNKQRIIRSRCEEGLKMLRLPTHRFHCIGIGEMESKTAESSNF